MTFKMPTHTALSFGVDLARDAVRHLAKESSVREPSPRPPEERGWGVPDWQAPNAYPTPDELDDLEWRWEFLRRRHGYRHDWLRPEFDFRPVSRQRYFLDVYELDFPFDPCQSVRNLAANISSTARRGTKDVFLFPASGLIPFRRALLSDLFATLDDLDRIIPTVVSDDDIFIRFDLGQPIKPQLEQIGYLLEKLRAEAYGDEETSRKRRQLWATYLRLLDAKDDGASLSEMTSVLSKHGEHTPQRARSALQAAEDLRRDWRYGSRHKE